MKENSYLVVKSNHLIESSYKLSLVEMKLISKLTSCIKKEDENFKVYKFKVKDLIEEFSLWKNNYKEIDKASEKLLSRVLTIKKEDWGFLKINFLSSFEYKKQDASIELCFDPKLRPYLLQIKSFFTSYSLKNIVSLKSFYSIRIYEILKQYQAVWERTISLLQLQEILGNKSYKYWMFKQRVLIKAQEELKNHSDIDFTFIEIKNWRKVESIKFLINQSQKPNPKRKLLLKDEKLALDKIQKEKDFYEKEELQQRESINKNLEKKRFVSNWIKENPKEYESLLNELKEVYLVRSHIQKEIIKI